MLELLIRRSWIIVLSAVVAGAAAWWTVRDQTPLYERTVSYVAQPSAALPRERIPDAVGALSAEGGVVTTIARVIGSERFLDAAARRAFGRRAGSAYELEASVSPGSSIIDTRFRGPNRRVLTNLTTAYTPIATAWVRTNLQAYELELLEVTSSAGAVYPRPRQTVILAALVGGLVGAALIFAQAKVREARARVAEETGGAVRSYPTAPAGRERHDRPALREPHAVPNRQQDEASVGREPPLELMDDPTVRRQPGRERGHRT